MNFDYFDMDLVRKLQNNEALINENQIKNQKFIMNLTMKFEDCESVYQLVENGDENTKIKFLSLKKFPDGVFIKEKTENEYEIVVVELKKTATSHLRKIPKQLHSGILNAISLLNLSCVGISNHSQQIQQRQLNVSYKLYVGSVNHGEKTILPEGIMRPKVIPGQILPSNNEKILYDSNIVSYKENGKTLEFSIEKLEFVEHNDPDLDYEKYECGIVV